jgi:hypothetical protein
MPRAGQRISIPPAFEVPDEQRHRLADVGAFYYQILSSSTRIELTLGFVLARAIAYRKMIRSEIRKNRAIPVGGLL